MIRLLLVAVAVLLAAAGQARAATGHVTVDPTRLGREVPRSFLGLSVEWDSIEQYAARPKRAASLAKLLAPLARSQGGLALRVGGNSADSSWWNPNGRPTPRIVLHDLDDVTVDALGRFARALGGPVTLGVNLALRDPENALALVRAAREHLPPGALEALEMGNEPDLYTAAKTFRVPGAIHRRVRKHARYGPGDYGRDVKRYLDVLRGAIEPRPAFAVGGFARPFWWARIPDLLDRWRDRARVLSVHMYAMPYCDAPPPPAAWLMTAEASRGLAAKIRPIARLARRRGLSLRVTEMNSGVCGGRPGISDRAYAAVWLADTLFALVNEGADQTDVHTWNHAVYAPFALTRSGSRVVRKPALDGMLAFARGAPAGSRIAASRASGAVRSWATRGKDGTVRVALVAPRSVRVGITVPRRRCASVWVATPRGRRSGRCGGRAVTLPARSVGVVTFRPPARAAADATPPAARSAG